MKKTIFMFSGQGSQYYQMGKELYESNSAFYQQMNELDSFFRQITGYSLLKQLYDQHKSFSDPFNDIIDSHPALYMFGYSAAMTLIKEGIKPDYLLGLSLGEMIALAVSGVFTAQEGLEIIIKQAQLVKQYCQPGFMLAILDHPSLYLNEELKKRSELAAVSFDNHFLLSGLEENLDSVLKFLKQKNILFQQLPVHYGFHSQSIEPMLLAYQKYLKTIPIKQPQLPLISCTKAAPVTSISPALFSEIIRRPIQFQQTIQTLKKEGDFIFIDLCPSGSLTNFCQYNFSDDIKYPIFTLINPLKRDKDGMTKMIAAYQREKDKDFTRSESKIKQFNQESRREEGKMITYLFAGQGVQKRGMGGDLFDQYPDITAQASELLGYSIKDLCLIDADNQLGNTQYTQPAIFTVSYLKYLDIVNQRGQKPDFLAGHSLGEISALCAAGAFDFERGLKIVQKRGEIMSQANGGAMAAVIGLDQFQISDILSDNHFDQIDIANDNSPEQIVLSGPSDSIEQAKKIFEQNNSKLFIPLKVSGAFHSRYMQEAAQEFSHYLESMIFSPLQIPVIANVTAQPYQQGTIKQLLTRQISNPVRWTESIIYLMNKENMEFFEIGPGNILTRLLTKIKEKKEDYLAKIDVQQNPAEKKDFATQNYKEQQKSFINGESLGNKEFKKEYHTKYTYVVGGMHYGISSPQLIINLAKAGILSFFGTNGLELSVIEKGITEIQKKLQNGEPYGMNLVHHIEDKEKDEKLINLFLDCQIKNIEISSFTSITPCLLKFRAKGLKKNRKRTYCGYS
ncbi:MAG: ACP S-malonyltransferase [Spirochaetes bacterium]|nr:ACP S-malonyltransferase [Spirochaetota bacterium]